MSEVHYYSNYAETRDIDCFFRVGDVAYHFASNGQPIPSFITRKTNMAVQDVVYDMLDNAKGEVLVYEEVIKFLIKKEISAIEEATTEKIDIEEELDRMVNEYADSFKSMARLGFVSMDLDEEGVYHVIAKPKGQMVSEDIIEILPVIDEGLLKITQER